MKQEKVARSRTSVLEKCHRWNVSSHAMSTELSKKRFPRAPSKSKHSWSTRENIPNAEHVIATDTFSQRPKTVSYEPSFRRPLATVGRAQTGCRVLVKPIPGPTKLDRNFTSEKII